MFFQNCPCCEGCPVVFQDDFIRPGGSNDFGPHYRTVSGQWEILDEVLLATGPGVLAIEAPHPDGVAEQIVTVRSYIISQDPGSDQFSILMAYSDNDTPICVRVSFTALNPYGEIGFSQRAIAVSVIDDTETLTVCEYSLYLGDGSKTDVLQLTIYYSEESRLLHVDVSGFSETSTSFQSLGLPARAYIPPKVRGTNIAIQSDAFDGIEVAFESIEYNVHYWSQRQSCLRPNRSCSLATTPNYLSRNSVEWDTTANPAGWKRETASVIVDDTGALILSDTAKFICQTRNELRGPSLAMTFSVVPTGTEIFKIFFRDGDTDRYYIKYDSTTGVFEAGDGSTVLDQQGGGPGTVLGDSQFFMSVWINESVDGTGFSYLSGFISITSAVSFADHAINVRIPLVGPVGNWRIGVENLSGTDQTLSTIVVGMASTRSSLDLLPTGQPFMVTCATGRYNECGITNTGIITNPRSCFDAPEEMIVTLNPFNGISIVPFNSECTLAECQAIAGIYFLQLYKFLPDQRPWNGSPCSWAYENPNATNCQPRAVALSMEADHQVLIWWSENQQTGLVDWEYYDIQPRSGCFSSLPMPRTLRAQKNNIDPSRACTLNNANLTAEVRIA